MSKNKKTSCLYQALAIVVGDTPPEFMMYKIEVNSLSDEQGDELQEWALDKTKLEWATGWGLIEAALMIVDDAVSNSNIGTDKFERPDDYDPAKARMFG